jgi:hypothetical protein
LPELAAVAFVFTVVDAVQILSIQMPVSYMAALAAIALASLFLSWKKP